MDAVNMDLADAVLPRGLGVGLGLGRNVGSDAQEQTSPTGRRVPRTPTRGGGEVRSPQTPLNLEEMDIEVEDGLVQQQVQEEQTPIGTAGRPTGVCDNQDGMQAEDYPTSTEPRLVRDSQGADEEELLQQGEVPFLANTPSTTESHRMFSDDDEYVLRTEFKKLRGQLKETRAVVRDMAAHPLQPTC